MLRQVRADFKTPMLMVTHESGRNASSSAKKCYVVREGTIRANRRRPARFWIQPANVDVARLLGAFNLLDRRDPHARSRAQDQPRADGRISKWTAVVSGPPEGRSRHGVRPAGALDRARPQRQAGRQPDSRAARTHVERPQWMRLEFAGGIAVDLSRSDYERVRDAKDWVIEFPRESLRVL